MIDHKIDLTQRGFQGGNINCEAERTKTDQGGLTKIEISRPDMCNLNKLPTEWFDSKFQQMMKKGRAYSA